MTDKTVIELALSIGRPVDQLLEQINDAGLPQRKTEDVISTKDQDILVSYLKRKHSINENGNNIILKQRKSLATKSVSARAKTINVEVRKIRTLSKPDPEQIKLEALQKIKNYNFESFYNFIKHHKIDMDEKDVEKRISFDEKSNIKIIDLSDLRLKSLNNLECLDLENLIEINLDDNNIRVLKLVNKMQRVDKISIRNNPLEAIIINAEIDNFKVLKGFDAKKIKVLNLSHNRFSSFKLKNNYENLKRFRLVGNLTEINEVLIDVNFNLIDFMDFSNSNIRKFSIIKDFPDSLSKLNLRNNQINYLKLPHKTFEKRSDNSYVKVNLENNNLPDLILSALKKRNEEERYRELRDIFFDVIEVNRVKLIFLGNTGVGKTTLYKVLKSEDVDYCEYNGNSTEGVNIFSYGFQSNNKNIEVKGFDFGGQDYYHNTHYSFFSTNALYILLWGNNQYVYHRSYFNRSHSDNESKIEITYPLNYWLGSVSYFINKEKKLLDSDFSNNGKNSKENVKLHLIQNPHHSDKMDTCDYDLDRVTLKNRYSFISGFETFPSLTNEHFFDYKDTVKGGLENIIKKYSKAESYPKILAKIERKLKLILNRNKKFIISTDDIQEIFFEENRNIGWEGNFSQILEWLDITMSIYWISDEKLSNFVKQNSLSLEMLDILSKYAVLDLSKLNELIHNILTFNLNDKEVKGFYRKSEINDLLGEFENEDVVNYVSAFMLYNKIYFEKPNKLDDEVVYIAPNYLNGEITLAEELFLESFDLPFIEYRFEDFYHVNIFTEVLVKYKSNLSSTNMLQDVDYLLWKNKAVLFENPNSDVSLKNSKKQPLVLLDFDLGEVLGVNCKYSLDDNSELKKPSIRISTYSKNRQPISEGFLKDIISFIDNQLIGYNYKKFALAPNQIDYIDIESIDNNLDNFDGSPTALFAYNKRIYRSADFSLFTNRKSAMKKIFISHSTDDYKEVQDFITHLQPFKRDGLIDHWHCSQLIPSTVWDPEIQKNLWDSDIICMLISPSWLANDYIFNKELTVAIERKELFKSSHDGRDIIIFPIIIKPCMWTSVSIISQFQAAPQKGKPVSTYADNNEAWCDIVRKLHDVLNLMDDPTYKPEIGGKLGQIYVNQYGGNLTKNN